MRNCVGSLALGAGALFEGAIGLGFACGIGGGATGFEVGVGVEGGGVDSGGTIGGGGGN